MATYAKDNPQWADWHSRKEKHPARGVMVRLLDCEVAEKVRGYRWLPHNPKEDFCGYKFSCVLTHPDFEVDASHILEPDTRVPNYSTSIRDAMNLARASKMKIIRVMDTDEDTCKYICEKALWRASRV